jgi:hypothetical protein
MHGDQDDLAMGRVDPGKPRIIKGTIKTVKVQEGLNDSVSCHEDPFAHDALPLQIDRGCLGWSQVQDGKVERWSIIFRLASPGNGAARSPERNPASQCEMGKWSQKAAIAPSVALNVSPWTITGAGSRAASCRSRRARVSAASSFSVPAVLSMGRVASAVSPKGASD